ncbi:hypothetical protein ONE63_001365 [Megalurothrips usitatus]|uniref:Archease domain-containing protein n=1 Tax=Megalurothrips usitatus TaxID=439358 RepID=A0AAV7XGJ2_9NEOP|nr:hypothetical protein ONE63_001365 [Megalurothrips usitatus]
MTADAKQTAEGVRNGGRRGGFRMAQYEFTDEETQLPPVKYEYLDHTADVQLHAWGDNIKEAFEQCAMAMFAYMTDIESVDLQEAHQIEAQGDDFESLLFHFLDEFLFLFSCEPFLIARKVSIIDFDLENFRIIAKGYGEKFDLDKHPQGTEVKAITYSNMQVHDKEGQHEVFVIIDI